MYVSLLVDTIFDDMEPEEAFSMMMQEDTSDMFTFVTEQMSAKKACNYSARTEPKRS
jgi:hypothetical protein